MSKNDNRLEILWMLNSGAKITAKQIAKKLETNVRTVYRYIYSLLASIVSIVSDECQILVLIFLLSIAVVKLVKWNARLELVMKKI